jgi:protein SCO1/2
VCPLTLATFRDVAKQLGSDAARVRFVFVTVDPEQDTPAFMDRYMRLFNPDFVGLTGAPDALKRVYEFFAIVSGRARSAVGCRGPRSTSP